MGEHERPEPDDVSKTVEVKVVAAAVAGLLASITYAVLDALSRDHHVLDGFPEWSRFVILTAIPPVLTFLAGYAVPSNRA